MEAIKEDDGLILCTVATGMHLSPEFGLTYRDIEDDGFSIDEKVETLMSSDTPAGVCNAMGLGMMGYHNALERLSPDILVILGDRFEAMAAAACALVLNLPVAHIHGGEKTIGAVDEGFRHAITKMSHLHFTSTEVYRNRVIQLGEAPERVFNVGALGVDNIKTLDLVSEQEVRKKFHMPETNPYLLVTFHPATLEEGTAEDQIEEVLRALTHDEFRHFSIIITKANADTGGRKINKRIDRFTQENEVRIRAVTSMGRLYYLSAMQHASAVIGNSSSGILEAPGFKVPVVNIGNRQAGRICASNVIHCPTCTSEIVTAISRAVSDAFSSSLTTMKNPYDQPHTAMSIKNILKDTDLSGILMKEFFDLRPEKGFPPRPRH